MADSAALRSIKTMVQPPSRIRRPRWQTVFLCIGAAAVSIHALYGTELGSLSFSEIRDIPLNIINLVKDMFPPDFSNYEKIGIALLETLQMCLVGTVLGVLISLPLGFFAARSLSPNSILYFGSRWIIAFCRTVPDMVWAIFFVIIVGLGPLAGMLTLLVDTVGFAGRFFAEAFEEAETGPQEALSSIGATGGGTFFSAILPASAPSCVNTSMYSLERAVQSSVVLGLVGAGGIGMLLEEPMTWHNYSEATAVVLAIFLMLVIVEQISSRVRQRIIR